MITAGGPYQTNPAMIDKMRELASIMNRIYKINSEVRWLSESKFQQDAAQYASPPMHKRPKIRRPIDEDVVSPEHDVSPTITGLHDRKKRQRHRMRTPGSTGAGFGGFRAPGASVGAHRT